MWRDPRKGTYDPKNRFSDYAWFYKFLNWTFMRCNQTFFIYIISQDMNYWKRLFERVRSGSYFFNRSPCKFSLLDRRSLFSDRVACFVWRVRRIRWLFSHSCDALLKSDENSMSPRFSTQFLTLFVSFTLVDRSSQKRRIIVCTCVCIFFFFFIVILFILGRNSNRRG